MQANFGQDLLSQLKCSITADKSPVCLPRENTEEGTPLPELTRVYANYGKNS